MIVLQSPSHRAALRFLRGGLVATAALLVPSQFGVVSRDAPALGPLLAALRVAIPAAGFALGGAVGAAALGRGRRTVIGFAAGLGLTGIALSFSSPSLQGLSGFEDTLTVVLFAASATAGAFGAGGLLAGLIAAPGRAAALGAGFAAGGVAGGLATVLPGVLALRLAAWPTDVRMFVGLACSLAGLLSPFAIGGALAAKALEDAGPSAPSGVADPQA